VPKARIGIREFERGIKFPGARGCDQLDCAFAFLPRPHVLQDDDLALIQGNAHFYEGPMCIHDDGVSFFIEGGQIGQFSFDDHANLKKQALAASLSRDGFHYSEASRVPLIRTWRDIKFL
jgi:hypothetical protein